MMILAGLFIGLQYRTHNSFVIDTINGLIHFPHFKMQVESANSAGNAKQLYFNNDDNLTVPAWPTILSQPSHDYPIQWTTRDAVTLLDKFIETTIVLASHSMSTTIHMKVTITVTKTTELLSNIWKNLKVLSSTYWPWNNLYSLNQWWCNSKTDSEGHSDLFTYVCELLWTNEPEYKLICSVFPEPKTLAKPKITPQYSVEHLVKFLTWNEMRDWSQRSTQGGEKNVNDSTLQIHCWWRKKQLKES